MKITGRRSSVNPPPTVVSSFSDSFFTVIRCILVHCMIIHKTWYCVEHLDLHVLLGKYQKCDVHQLINSMI